MDILTTMQSPDIDLSYMGIDTTYAATFGDVIECILDHAERHSWDPKGEKIADRQWASIHLPLRSAILQQAQVTSEELQWITEEAQKTFDTQWQYQEMDEFSKQQRLLENIDSKVGELRRQRARKITKLLLWEDVQLVWFVWEETTKKQLKTIISGSITPSSAKQQIPVYSDSVEYA